MVTPRNSAIKSTSASLRARIVLLAISPIAFILLAVYGGLTHNLFPAIGDLPVGISALLSAAVIIEAFRNKCVCKTQASIVVLLLDLVLASAHFVMFVLTHIYMRDLSYNNYGRCYGVRCKGGVIMLAGYGNLFFLIFAAMHVYMAVKGNATGGSGTGNIDHCEDCNSITLPSPRSMGLRFFGRSNTNKGYTQLSVQADDDRGKGKAPNEEGEDEEEAMLRPSAEEEV